MILQEDDLEFDFTGAVSAVKFDDGTHSSSSIQPVDFIIEFDDFYRFIEVKDPDKPGAANVSAFQQKLMSGSLIRSLAGKYRDSVFFRSFQNCLKKDIQYVVLISMQALDDALLVTKQDQLKRSIPFSHPAWQENSAKICVILNINQWKRMFGNDSVRRLSSMTP